MESSIELVEIDGGKACILPVRAQPGAKRAGVAGVWNGMLKIAVTAPPDRGRANESLVELVAELFDLRRSAVRLVSGEHAREKKLRLDAEPCAVRARIAELLA